MKLKFLYLLLSIALLSNCTVKKRSYQKGYYVSFNKHSVKPKAEKKTEPQKDLYPSEFEKTKSYLASNATGNELAMAGSVSKPLIDLGAPADSCGDMITLTNGKQILAQVTEINEDIIKYKRCDNLSGPSYSEHRNNIAQIKYVNGVVEHFTAPGKYNPEPQKKYADPNSCGDMIYFKTGSSVKAKVVSDSGDVLKYKICNRNDDRIFIASKKSVTKIVYEDNTGNSNDFGATYSVSKPKKVNNGFALASFIISTIIILPYFMPIGVVLGLVALNQMKKNPDKYGNKWMAYVGVIVGTVVTALATLLVWAWVGPSIALTLLLIFDIIAVIGFILVS